MIIPTTRTPAGAGNTAGAWHQEIKGSRMRIHRSAHLRFFTTLGNEVLRDSRLSFCARGILAHLLSQPDGKRDDIRTLTERTPEGRERVAAAMRELERFGYLKRTKTRTSEGRIYTEVDVFDTPGGPSAQVEPNAGFPASGRRASSPGGGYPLNRRSESPTHPAAPVRDAEDGREGNGEAETKASAELLTRVAHAEPKLSLGQREVLQLAPLVTEWRRRGASEPHLISSLTSGLPRGGVHHAARFLEARLIAKMPAERRAAPSRLECDECGAPILGPGLCRSCREIRPASSRTGTDFTQMRTRGAAMARAALRGLSADSLIPAVA